MPAPLPAFKALLWCPPAAAGLVHKAQQLRLLPWRGSDAGAAVCGSPGAPPGAPGVCAAAGCLRSCVAVHAWAQVVLGALLPLCVLWAVEEWSRLRFQRQWLECYELAPATPSAAAGEQPGGSSRQATAQPPVAQPAPPPPPSPELRPAPWYALLLGLLACAWAVLATLDLAVLPPS